MHSAQNSRISRIIFKIQEPFKDPSKFSLKFKDFSRISRINMKFKDFKDFSRMWQPWVCCQIWSQLTFLVDSLTTKCFHAFPKQWLSHDPVESMEFNFSSCRSSTFNQTIALIKVSCLGATRILAL